MGLVFRKPAGLELVAAVAHLGVELRNTDGLCDFPSLMDGREIYLCWQLGEPTVDHWHEQDAGFAGRRRVADVDVDATPAV